MARTQARIGAAIWSDPDWCALTGVAQRAYLLLLTQPKLTLAGCLDWHPKRWDRLAIDGAERPITDALGELIDARFIVAHDDELVIRSFVRNDLCSGSLNRNMVKGFWGAWAAIASPLLRKVVVDETPEQVWSYHGAEPPAAALAARLEPRLELPLRPPSEPRLEPPSEPTSTSTPATCLLPAAVIPSSISGPPQGAPAAEPQPVDEQDVNRAVQVFGRLAAERAGADKPLAYAAKVGRALPDEDRDALRASLGAGLSVDEAAASLLEERPVVSTLPDPEQARQAREAAARLAERTRTHLEAQAASEVGDVGSGLSAARGALRAVGGAS